MANYSCAKLTQEEADLFVEENHSQKALASPSSALGLYRKGELIGVLQMGAPRTAAMARKYSAELYRLAFKRNVRAPGGASKLIKHYIATYHPADFFTYQDTTGENTAVYAHSGMTLVSDGLKKRKQYFVAPGKTLASADRREALGAAYATRYGPDRILGTKLGEVFDTAGNRKSNKQIFLEDLGWHIEETSGDSLWEWVDTNRTYYTYRITATDSEKYYYGVSHVKEASASKEACEADGYFGSGGKSGKFSHWKQKHRGQLVKEVISLHERKSQAYAAEKALVGELNKTDPACLNSIAGGVMQPHAHKKLLMKNCSIHGDALHDSSLCLKCRAAQAYSTETCATHGDTVFHGGHCLRCAALQQKAVKLCPIHGATTHQGKQCYKCLPKGALELCSVHGESIHYAGKCMKCRNAANVETAICPTHGEVKHIGNVCYICNSRKAVQLKECPVHGLSKHRGEKCFKCRTKAPAVTEKLCSIHGLSKHQGETCAKCSRGAVTTKLCAVHGETKHRGNACFKCVAAARNR